MDSQTQPVTELFRDKSQYLIPLFQRGYVWGVVDGRQQVPRLWADIVDRVEAHEIDRADRKSVEPSRLRPVAKHFLGAIVLGPKRPSASGAIEGREVIDGQQRLTTLQLLMLALRDEVRDLGEDELEADLKALTLNHVRDGRGTDRLKVLPTHVGREDMACLSDAGSTEAVVERWPAASGERPRMVEAYLYFAWMIRAWISGHTGDEVIDTRRGTEYTRAELTEDSAVQLDAPPPIGGAPDPDRAWLLFETLGQHLELVELRLGESDDPQVIFESLNALGEPLRPSDLIRNFLFLQATRSGADVDALYDRHWRQFDEEKTADGELFWHQEQRQGRLTSPRIDVLLFNVATLRLAQTLKIAHVFERFKSWWTQEPSRSLDDEMERIAKLTVPMRTVFEPDGSSAFARFSRRMQWLDTATHVPLLLAFAEHFAPDSAELGQVMNDVESYCVRRLVCGMSTNGYNRTFSERILREVNARGTPDPDVVRAVLLEQTNDSARWPEDAEFAKAWRSRRLYRGTNTSRVQAILWGLEEQLDTGRQEYTLNTDGVSVEHVLPQKWNEDDHPFREGATETLEPRDDLVHSIGNLTLVTPGFNSSLSNRPFVEKRRALAQESALRLNAEFQDAGSRWAEEEILARADRLFETAVAKWARPRTASGAGLRGS